MTTDIEPRVAPILPMDPAQARSAMAQYQKLTEAMLVDDDWQRITDNRRFVKRSGWSKISTGYGLSTKIVAQEIDRDETGQIVRAHVTVRAEHPNGRAEEANGGCSINEDSFQGKNAGSKRAKAEHDIPATAATRARNRAISNLVGFGAVSAEELDGGGGDNPTGFGPPPPPWGPWADEEDERATVEAVRRIEPAADAEGFVIALGKKFKEGIPAASVIALKGLARYLGDVRAIEATKAVQRDPDPTQQPDWNREDVAP